MNKRGLTLVEVILAIAILGIISAAFIPLLAGTFRNVFQAKELTKDLFKTQQNLEKTMEIARNEDTDPSDYTLDIFGKSVTGHELSLDILSDSGKSSGAINVFVPKYKVVYNVPEIESATIKAYKSGVLLTDPQFLFPLDSTITFIGSYVPGTQQDFLMNVYRWYMSPITNVEPANYHDWIIVKEWNEARTPLSYADSDDFTFIPNIEANYNSLNFARDFGLTDDETGIRFAGRYFVYSVTPYSLAGRIGEEIFSNAISTNRIESIDPVYKSVEWSGTTQYDIRSEYSTVMAKMQYGEPQSVDVTWDQPIIDITSPTQDEVIRTGHVIGYSEPVEFHLTVDDEFTLTSIEITGNDRLQVPFASQGATQYTYNFSALDQNDNPMTGEQVSWSLPGGPYTGLSINSTSGVLAINNTVGTFSFNVRATSVTDPAIYKDMTIRTAKVDSSRSTVIVTNNASAKTTSYTVTLLDDQGLPITIADMDAIWINNRFVNSLPLVYRSLTDADGVDRRNYGTRVRFYVNTFMNNNNGTYNFTLQIVTNTSTYTDNTGGLEVQYYSGSVSVKTGLTIRIPNR